VRHKVLGMAILLGSVTYLDRVAMSVLRGPISQEFGLSDVHMGYVFSAFYVAYGAFEIPTGWWADKVGSRRVLTRIVAWWSAFTILTGAVFSYWSLLVVRFLFGAGEAGAFPNVARTFSRWFPQRERGRAQGTFWVGAHLAGGVTPFIVNSLLEAGFHWRTIFLMFGSIGFVWAYAWWRWFRDTPEEHAAVTEVERAYIAAGRPPFLERESSWHDWKRLLGNRTTLGLCLMYFTQSFGGAFYVTWLPKYFVERGLTGRTAAILAGLPLIFSAIADILGGVTTDAFTRRFGLRLGRTVVGGSALAMAGIFTLSGTLMDSAVAAAVLIALGGASSNFLLAAAWGTCIDIGRSRAGALSGAMNTSGQVGAILSPTLIALVVSQFSTWSAPLYLTGTLFLLGSLCWLWIDPAKPVSD
jgi:MFS family permease